MPAKRPLTAGQRALLAAQAAAAERERPSAGISRGVVVAVVPGAARDGRALAVVSWLGTDVEVPYLAAYSPVVGHVVALAVTGSQLLILDRIVATP